jgi:thioredoxin reductase (NADPH)
VIGDTTRALLGAVELARTAERVYLIAPDAEQLESPLAQALHHLPNIEIFAGYTVVEVRGAPTVEEVVIAREEQMRRLRVQRAFVALGLVPNSELVRGIAETDARGFISVDHAHRTSTPGRFAAGDVTTASCEQVLVAIGDGARAAISAYQYLLAWSLAHQQPSRGVGSA